MKFEEAAGPNPIDRLKVVGRATDRIEGPLKTTGLATYAYEHRDGIANPAYGWIVGAGIGKGRIAAIDMTASRTAPGVLAIVTAENAGPLERGEFYADRLLAGPAIDHYHQAVAVVVAETFEQARAAAALLRITYAPEPGRFDLEAARANAPTSAMGPYRGVPYTAVGDFEAAFASAPIQLDETYRVPPETHAAMEPHATIARWDGERLTCWTTIQQLNWGVRDLARIFGMPKENIRMLAPFIGGSFGGKGTVLADCALAAVAARITGRPVKIAMPRALVFNNTNHRAATVQRIRLGATPDGKLTALGHESWSGNLPGGRPESTTASTRLLYAAPNRLTHLRLAELDLPEGGALRAPGEAPGLMALEIAMDEMAEKLGLDPVEFRIRNDTQVDPEKPARRFSKRQLVECLRLGADRFGWSRRSATPAGIREGNLLIGMGCAAAIRGAPILKSAARVRLGRDGNITVETDMTDVGTGSYTIIGQTAAEMMGVPIDQVSVRLGDSSFPESPGTGGQWGAASVTAGVYATCMQLRASAAQALGFNSDEVAFEDGHLVAGNRRVPLAEAARDGERVAEEAMSYGDLATRYALQTFGAHFVEVAVDVFTGETRLRRMLATCAAGRILNPKAARSQVIGAMVMGAGAALTEEMVVDTRHGFFVNHDLAGYEVPVHADIPAQEVIFLDEVDELHSPMKAKGVGELGICGVAAAIANAVYNATGIRVRDYPVTVDKLIGRLPG